MTNSEIEKWELKWVLWSDQNDLAITIRDWIDTGSSLSCIIKNVLSEKNNKYTKEEIEQEVLNLKKKWLIVDDGSGYFNVTAWSYSSIMNAMKNQNWTKCLKKLKRLGVYHPDMVIGNIIKKEEAPKCP